MPQEQPCHRTQVHNDDVLKFELNVLPAEAKIMRAVLK